ALFRECGLEQIVVVGRDGNKLRPAVFGERPREAREEPVERRRYVTGVEDLAQEEVELVLAARCVDVLRHAQEVPLPRVGIATARCKVVRELRAARQERAPPLPRLVAPVAEVRPRSEEGDHASFGKLFGYRRVVLVVCPLHHHSPAVAVIRTPQRKRSKQPRAVPEEFKREPDPGMHLLFRGSDAAFHVSAVVPRRRVLQGVRPSCGAPDGRSPHLRVSRVRSARKYSTRSWTYLSSTSSRGEPRSVVPIRVYVLVSRSSWAQRSSDRCGR